MRPRAVTGQVLSPQQAPPKQKPLMPKGRPVILQVGEGAGVDQHIPGMQFLTWVTWCMMRLPVPPRKNLPWQPIVPGMVHYAGLTEPWSNSGAQPERHKADR
jgi:hypothetical protein